MNLYRIPATLQAAKTAALAGAKVAALREHLEKDGRYVMHDHNKLIAELDIYFNAVINDIINWMESLNNPVKEISLKEVPTRSSYPTEREVLKGVESSFIRQVSRQFYQGKNTISFRFKHPDGTPRSGCIIYDVTGHEGLWNTLVTYTVTGGSIGHMYNKYFKGIIPVIETTLSEDV